VQGYPGAWNIVFTDKDKIINHKDAIENSDLLKTSAFLALLKDRGIITAFRFCVSAVHTEKDIKDALVGIEDALLELKEMYDD